MEAILKRRAEAGLLPAQLREVPAQGRARAEHVPRRPLPESRLESILPEIGFDDMRVPFYCNAVRLETGGSVFWGTPGFDDISLVDAVYSSCALPGIFEPYERDGYSYMDGGIVDSLPLRFAKTLRPELIIAVDLSVKATFKTPNYKNRVRHDALPRLRDRRGGARRAVAAHARRPPHGADPAQGRAPGALRLPATCTTSCAAARRRPCSVLTSHAATRDLVRDGPDRGPLLPGDAARLRQRAHRPRRLHRLRPVRGGVRDRRLLGRAASAPTVRKLSNYECTRDHACARNCPTGAISLGNL